MAIINRASRIQARPLIERTIRFLREARTELKKVIWPNRKELVNYTAVVIVMVIIVSGFVGIIDFGLSELLSLFSGFGG